MVDAYTKAVLTVIALALVVLVVRPLVEPGPANAAGPVEVKVVGWSVSQISVAASLSPLPLAVQLEQQVPVVCVSGCR